MEIFYDGIGQVNVTNGIVRINLLSIKPGDGQNIEGEPCGRIVTTVNGFLNTLGMLSQMADKMVEAGMLQRTTNTPDATNDKASDATKSKSSVSGK